MKDINKVKMELDSSAFNTKGNIVRKDARAQQVGGAAIVQSLEIKLKLRITNYELRISN